jgi:REP element-mobilizing transposase RayT
MHAALRERLWLFLGGMARQHDMKALAIGGMPDHVHMLLYLRPTLPIHKAMQLIKGGSPKWVDDTFREQWQFGWQAK